MRITVNKLDNGYTTVRTVELTQENDSITEVKQRLVWADKDLLLEYLGEQL